MKKPRGKDIIYYLTMTVLLVIFISSAGILAKNYIQDRRHGNDLDQLAGLFPEVTVTAAATTAATAAGGTETEPQPQESETSIEDTWMQISPQDWKLYWDTVAAGRFSTYQSLKKQNADFVGWVRIEGTQLDYPVLQTPNDPDYYLHRDFEKKSSRYGIPYMMESCRLEEPRTNYLVYGHHMRNGSMFAALQNYTDYNYYKQHPYIQFDALNQAGSYEIVAVVKVDNAGDPSFWQEVLFPSGEAAFDSAWKQFQKKSFYDTGVSITAYDHLLALVTCEYTLKDGRLMVVAREIPREIS